MVTETYTRFEPDYVGPMESFMHKPLTKLMLFGQPGPLSKVRGVVRAKVGDEVNLSVSDDKLIAVTNRRANKASGVAPFRNRARFSGATRSWRSVMRPMIGICFDGLAWESRWTTPGRRCMTLPMSQRLATTRTAWLRRSRNMCWPSTCWADPIGYDQ